MSVLPHQGEKMERTLGWRMRHRRLARDYEALPEIPDDASA
jgi:hypothetical protein